MKRTVFDSVPVKVPKKNKFDLSHDKKLTCDMGWLIPILYEEAVPGDVFRVRTEAFIRLLPLLAPIMHRVKVYFHYFAVPWRLVWDESQDYLTGGPDGNLAPLKPYFRVSTDQFVLDDLKPGGLWDYFGLPTVPTNAVGPISGASHINALPFRAYQMVYNEYFRDQTLCAEILVNKTSGQVSSLERDALLQKRRRAWQKDYFTSALPWAQRGPQVLMPVEGEASWEYRASDFVRIDNNLPVGNGDMVTDAGYATVPSVAPGIPLRVENLDSIEFTNTTVTISEFRRSLRLQEYLEKMAVGGSRYNEQMLMIFGVKSSDARLQRPEYLGGSLVPIQIQSVISNFESYNDETGLPSSRVQGNPSGQGIATNSSKGFKKFFEEHSIILGIMSIIPETAYMQGIHRNWTRADRFEEYWPDFALIGEQAILNKEIYVNWEDDTGVRNETWGYQSRYAEMKYSCSTVHGMFREDLDFWHMGRIFADQPSLSETFVMSNPTDRIYAVNSNVPPVSPLNNGNVLVHLYNRVDAIRPIPYYSMPRV